MTASEAAEIAGPALAEFDLHAVKRLLQRGVQDG